jgi:hypothetical protein
MRQRQWKNIADFVGSIAGCACALWVLYLIVFSVEETPQFAKTKIAGVCYIAIAAILLWERGKVKIRQLESELEHADRLAGLHSQRGYEYIRSLLNDLGDPVRSWALKIERPVGGVDYTVLTEADMREIRELRHKIRLTMSTAYLPEYTRWEICEIRNLLLALPWFLFPRLDDHLTAELGISNREIRERLAVQENLIEYQAMDDTHAAIIERSKPDERR